MPSRLMRLLPRSIRQPASENRPNWARGAVPRFRPRLEILEERELLTVYTVTNMLDSVVGSLRWAIFLAQDGDTVQFAQGLSGQITLLPNPGELAVNHSISIEGPGADVLTVSANQKSRIFNVAANQMVSITGLTIADGQATDQQGSGGGIYNAGKLSLADCVIRHNTAPNSFFGINGGGGLYNAGELTLNGCTVADNSGGGIFNSGMLTVSQSTILNNTNTANGEGGGVHNLGTLTATDCVITGNTGDLGGGLCIGYSSANLTDCTISNNNSNRSGGGIYNGSVLTVTGCAITGNTVKGNNTGGGGISNGGNLTVSSSTISYNSAATSGGGIYNSGVATLTADTIAGNSAGSGGGIYNSDSSGFVTQPGLKLISCTVANNSVTGTGGGIAEVTASSTTTTATLVNTLVARNTAATAKDISGPIVATSHHNLVGDGSNGVSGLINGINGNQVGVYSIIDPLLGPLQDNGGPTLTMSLLPSSPAIGAGDPTNSPPYDQRGSGFPRIVNGTIDIGAYEAPGTSSSITVTSSQNPSVFGQAVTFTATVTAVAPATGTPTGTVVFLDGITTLGTGKLDTSGVVTFTTPTALPGGNHAITAVYGGDAVLAASISGVLTQIVNQASSTTAMTSSANPSVFGQAVTFTATVSAVGPSAAIPTGTVTFRDGTTTLGTATLTKGTTMFTTTALSVGNHSVTVVYGGNGNIGGSTSTAVTQTVTPANTTSSVTTSPNPSVFGQAVTLTATVSAVGPSAAIPTGTVTFYDGTTMLGTATLTNGKATLTTTTTALVAGSHPITIVYSINASFGGSTSTAVTQMVNPANTTSTVTSSSPSSSVFGQAVTFTGTVKAVAPSAATPTGTVTFLDGTTSLASTTLNPAGQATFTTSALSVGSHSITVVYGINANFTGSTSAAPLTQTVKQSNSASKVASSPNPSVSGQAVTFTAKVMAAAPGSGTPTGTVSFNKGTTTLGTATLDASGSATFTTASLSVASHSITVVYGNDVNFSSTSSAITQKVLAQPNSTSTVSSSLNPSVSGQAVTFTATVAHVATATGTPTGMVTFLDGTTSLGTATLTTGKATFKTTTLAVGSHSISVVYGGDANFTTSTSLTLTQTVTAGGGAPPTQVDPGTGISQAAGGSTQATTASVYSPAQGYGWPSGVIDSGDYRMEHDSLKRDFNVTAALDDTLNIALLNSFFARAGDSYRVLTYGSESGVFAAINDLDLGSSFLLNPLFDATGLSLVTKPKP